MDFLHEHRHELLDVADRLFQYPEHQIPRQEWRTTSTLSAPGVNTLADSVGLRAHRQSITCSPVPESETFSELTGNSIYLKAGKTGSEPAPTKSAGAGTSFLVLLRRRSRQGVIAARQGNQRRRLSIPCIAIGNSRQNCDAAGHAAVKVPPTRGYGGEVILHGANYDEACRGSHGLSARVTDVRPCLHDDAVIAGQGTLGWELLEHIPT